jgi:hypothetical protein
MKTMRTNLKIANEIVKLAAETETQRKRALEDYARHNNVHIRISGSRRDGYFVEQKNEKMWEKWDIGFDRLTDIFLSICQIAG